jgi:hypothetical protein
MKSSDVTLVEASPFAITMLAYDDNWQPSRDRGSCDVRSEVR